MIVAVLDANTIVSATISPLGIPHQVVLAAQARQYRWLTSAPIVAEVLRALQRPRIQRRYNVTAADLQVVQDLLTEEAVSIPLTVTVRGVAAHPEDDLILATAASARADYLVTGDRQLRALGAFQGVTIVTPREFLTILHTSARKGQGTP